MINKYEFGIPFETDAVVKQIKKSSGIPKGVQINCDNGFSFKCKIDSDTIVYGLGQSIGGINKRNHLYSSFCSDDPSHTEEKQSLYGAHNFIIIHNPNDSKSDRAFFFDYPGKISFDIGYSKIDEIYIYAERSDIALYEILPELEENKNPLINIVYQFRKLIGQSYIAPLWAFGFMQSRWGYKTEADIRNVYESYKKENIPLDSICLDIDYMKDFKDFTVDKDRFPELKKFSDDLKTKGIRLVPIIDAGVKIEDGYDVYEEGVENNYFCKKQNGENFVAGVWPGKTHFPDFMQKQVRHWFGQKYKILTDMGIEGFWNDMNEPAIFYSEDGLSEVVEALKKMDTTNLDINSFFQFKDNVYKISNSIDDYKRFYHQCVQNNKSVAVNHYDIHNLYGFNMTKSAGEELASIRKGKRTLLFSRASYIGMHRYGGIWTGDNASWWSHLALEIKMMPSLNMCGFIYSGADIGGFGCNSNRELLLRWLAFGIFTPLMRNHSALGTRNQECYQFENTKDFKAIIEVRYRLIPYLYSEYIKSCVNSTLMFKPLSFVFTEDSRCLEIEDQLILGDEVMICPVCNENAKGRIVYLPEDMIQVRFKSDGTIEQQEFKKGDSYINVPLNEVVFFIRKNHIVPIVNACENTNSLDYSTISLLGDVNGTNSYLLYKDDGVTTEIDMTSNIVELK